MQVHKHPNDPQSRPPEKLYPSFYQFTALRPIKAFKKIDIIALKL